jgi:TonB family protein
MFSTTNSHRSNRLSRALVVSIGIHLAAIAILFFFELIYPGSIKAEFSYLIIPPETLAGDQNVAAPQKGIEEHGWNPPAPVPHNVRTNIPMPAVPEEKLSPAVRRIPQDLLGVIAANVAVLTEAASGRPAFHSAVSPAMRGSSLEFPRDAGFEPAPPAIAAGGKLRAAEVMHRAIPVYPALAITARVQGTVLVRAVVTTEGALDQLEAVKGHPLLIEAALDCVRQWRYRPAMLNGQAIESVVTITVNFVLTYAGNG